MDWPVTDQLISGGFWQVAHQFCQIFLFWVRGPGPLWHSDKAITCNEKEFLGCLSIRTCLINLLNFSDIIGVEFWFPFFSLVLSSPSPSLFSHPCLLFFLSSPFFLPPVFIKTWWRQMSEANNLQTPWTTLPEINRFPREKKNNTKRVGGGRRSGLLNIKQQVSGEGEMLRCCSAWHN